jgi:predicted 3-demethylubiquinone-9 3-methyltransferase (glyoxalase superfamily)
MLTITPFLWFETQAEEAMNFYTTIFPRSTRGPVKRAGDQVFGVEFEIEGQKVFGMNGRPPKIAFNESVSFFVGCETQQEIDTLWTKLTADGGKPGRCGWLVDKFGMSWQIVPNTLGALLGGGGDQARAKRVMETLMTMSKLEVAALQRAYDDA